MRQISWKWEVETNIGIVARQRTNFFRSHKQTNMSINIIGRTYALCNEIGNFVHLDKPFEAIFYE